MAHIPRSNCAAELRGPPPRSWRALARARIESLRGERGFTLIEMLVTAALGLVVIGGPLAWIVVSINQQDQTSSISFATRQAEIGLEALTRDLHQAYNAQLADTTATATPISVTTAGSTTTLKLYLPPSPGQLVTWSCTVPASSVGCTRTTGGASRGFLPGLQSISFTTQNDVGGNAAYMAIDIKVNPVSQLDSGSSHQVSGGKQVEVQGGAALRSF